MASSTPPGGSSSAYLYLLYGEDEFTRSEQVATLREKMRRLPAGEYNITQLDGSVATVDEVLGACEAVPFVAERRMVIVSGLLGRWQAGSTGRGARSRKRAAGGSTEELQRLLAALPEVPSTTSLVLEEGALDEQLVAQVAGPRVVARRFDRPRGERLVRWIQQRAQAHGAELDQQVARVLAAESEDLRRLDGELAKLALFCPGPIDVEAVHLLVASAEVTIFALLDAVAARKAGDALTALRHLYQQGQRPEAVVAQLASLARRLLIVTELARTGSVTPARAAANGLNPNVLSKLQRQARAFKPDELQRALERLLEADRASKTGRLDPELAVELAVAELAGV